VVRVSGKQKLTASSISEHLMSRI